jgi:YgiT-type zinc finger domain-containing protein
LTKEAENRIKTSGGMGHNEFWNTVNKTGESVCAEPSANICGKTGAETGESEKGRAMKCPACGNSEMITKIQDETLSFGGQSLTLHLMKGDFCPTCGEGIWDEESYLCYTETQTAIIRAAKGDVSAVIQGL